MNLSDLKEKTVLLLKRKYEGINELLVSDYFNNYPTLKAIFLIAKNPFSYIQFYDSLNKFILCLYLLLIIS